MTETQLTGHVRSDGDLIAWLGSGNLVGVDALVLWDAGLTDSGAVALANSHEAGGLVSIDLSWNHVGARGAGALTRLPALRSLRLYHNDAGLAGARAVAEHGGALESLNMCGNAIGDPGLAVLSRGTLANLRELALGWNELGSAGIEALLRAPWPQLAFLNLRCNKLGPAAAARLLSGALPALTRLGIDQNSLGAEGLRAIVAAPCFSQLEWLNLGDAGLDDGAFDAHWPFGGRLALRELRVYDNDLSDAMLARLRGALPDCEVKA